MRRLVVAALLVLVSLILHSAGQAQETSADFSGGSMIVGYDSTCDSSLAGSIRYDSSGGSLQYCGVEGGVVPTGCTNVGDACTDGSYYIGQVGGNDIYATDAANESNELWDDGTWEDDPADSTTDGATNTANLVADQPPPHDAAAYCDGLMNIHSHSDWYLPARDELDLFWNSGTPIASVLENGTWYWSSTEFNTFGVWSQRFSNGTQQANAKTFASAIVRCVRRDGPYTWQEF